MHALSDLRKIVQAAGYEREALSRIGHLTPVGRTADPVAIEEATADPTKANTLARLFYMARSVSHADAELALAPLGCDPLVKAGLLVPEGDRVRSMCAVLPVGDLIVCRDFDSWASGKPMADDFVLGVGLASRMLADFTIRTPAKIAVDLCTGQGYQAMLASRHAARVIGTDINPRAIRLAHLSLAFSGITNVELRTGSMFEPVEPEKGRVELLVSNPPFVIAPPHDMSAIGGQWEGDRFVQSLLETTPEYLAEGGYATVVCNWHHPTPDAWQDRPRSWLEGRGVDAWMVRFKTDDPRTYATAWLRESASVESEAAMVQAVGKVDTWLDYYSRIGVGAVSLGVVWLRKRTPGAGSPANFLRFDSLPLDKHSPSSSDQARRLFDNELLLRAAPDHAALLDHRLAVSPHAELHQRSRPAAGVWKAQQSVLREVQGFEFSVGLDNLTALLLARLDGTISSRNAVTDLAKSLGADPELALRESAPFLAKMLAGTHVERRD